MYGVVSIDWILKQPTGNDRMREIAAAIQEGAQAYLNRQYTTIGMVGVGPVRRSSASALGWHTAIGFADRRGPLRPDRLHRHERLGARQRAHRRSRRSGLNAALNVAFKGGAITGMLVVGLGLLGVAGYYAVLHQLMPARQSRQIVSRWSASASAVR